jgi:hypothetical protein
MLTTAGRTEYEPSRANPASVERVIKMYQRIAMQQRVDDWRTFMYQVGHGVCFLGLDSRTVLLFGYPSFINLKFTGLTQNLGQL